MVQVTRLFASLTGLASRSSHTGRSTPSALQRAAVLTVVLTLASLTFAESAIAQGQRIVLTGTDQRFFGVPAKQWVAGGWTQVRDVPLTGTFAFRGAGVVLAGSESQLDNARVDANGNGRAWGRVTFIDAATGLTCSGPLQGQLTNFAFSGIVVARCSDGSLLTGTLHDTAITPFVEADARFDGVLLKRSQTSPR